MIANEGSHQDSSFMQCSAKISRNKFRPEFDHFVRPTLNPLVGHPSFSPIFESVKTLRVGNTVRWLGPFICDFFTSYLSVTLFFFSLFLFA